MSGKVRRSWLVVPMSEHQRVESAHLAGADVVVLDLVEFVAESGKPAARELVQPAIDRVKAGGGEVFAQVEPDLIYADLRACVWPGLAGVVVARLESPDQIVETDRLIGELEEERGLLPGSLEIAASVETARGNLNAFEIANASPRVTTLTLGRAELVMDLRPEPSGEIHLMEYLMQRLVMVANACGVDPVGAWWREPDRGLLATPDRTLEAAVRGRAIGFKGSFCVLDNQAGALNQGFTPSVDEKEAAQGLLESYRAIVGGSEAGKMPESMNVSGLEGQGELIIDSGAAAQAENLVALAVRCAQRDEEKAAALEERPVPTR